MRLKNPFRTPASRQRTSATSEWRIQQLEERLVLFGPQTALELFTTDNSLGFTLQGVANVAHIDYVSSAGDFNGDGIDDFIVGTATDDPPFALPPGRSFLFYGQTGSVPAISNITNVSGLNGFEIVGLTEGTPGVGSSNVGAAEFVRPAGDVNGDGYDDILIGHRHGDRLFEILPGVAVNREDVGHTYVIFGRPGTVTSPLNVSTLDGTNGFRIQGINEEDGSGRYVDAAGDFNGDGFDDIIIGAPGVDTVNPRLNLSATGAAYVVFGKNSGYSPVLNLETLNGSNGFVMLGRDENGLTGTSVRGAGDMNGDGFDDVVVGSPGWSTSGADDRGAIHVLFGRSSSLGTSIEVATLTGSNGFTALGFDANSGFGSHIAGLGDVNGDGYADIIAADEEDDQTPPNVGVILGKASGFPASPTVFTNLGFTINNVNGPPTLILAELNVGDVGDLDGDGYDDFAIGNRTSGQGSIVVFGNPLLGIGDQVHYTSNGVLLSVNPPTLSVTVGQYFYNINDEDNDYRVISALGDINGDGLSDLGIVDRGYPNGTPDWGRAYQIFGNDFSTRITEQGTTANQTFAADSVSAADRIVGGAGNDTILDLWANDVAYGGLGNDTITSNNNSFVRIDGGGGYDLVNFIGSGRNIDLSVLNKYRLRNIEAIRLNSTNQVLSLNYRAVLNLSNSSNSLDVRRASSTSSVIRGSGWTDQGLQVVSGVTYRVYTQGVATLRVEEIPADLPSITGPTNVVRSEPVSYVLSGASGVGPFSFFIDWNGDGISDQTVVGPNGTSVARQWPNSGSTHPQATISTIRVRAADTGSILTDWSNPRNVTINPFQLRPSTSSPGLTDLVVGGTSGMDSYFFTGFVGLPIQWFVLAENVGLRPGQTPFVFGSIDNNGNFQGNYLTRILPAFNGDLIVYGGEGFNYISAEAIFGDVQLYGGINDDVLIGGTGSDIIVGGDGNDILRGGSLAFDGNDFIQGGNGRDILIGHLGIDFLQGGAGDDLLIAGSVSFGTLYLPGKLFEIQFEWNSNRSYQQRVNNISNLGSGPRFNGNTFLIPGSTVFDDATLDTAFGDLNLDWFLVRTSDDETDKAFDELLTLL